MPYPFLRKEEQTAPAKTRTHPGLRVIHPDGTIHFYPGDEQKATSLMELACPEQVKTHPGTRIEFGEKLGPTFAVKKVIKDGIPPTTGNMPANAYYAGGSV